ncbi:MAG: hypothetical protein AAF298_00220 [Cyanobacteria bacterium P01_A01_bin.40]
MNLPVNFYKRTFSESIALIKANLTKTAYQMIELFSASAVFGDGFVYIPSVQEIANLLGRKKSCIYANLKRIREAFPYLQIITARSVWLVGKSSPDTEKNLSSNNLENIPVNRNYFQEYVINSNNTENQQLELSLDKTSSPPQTIQTDPTCQTGKVEKKVKEKEVAKAIAPQQKLQTKSFTLLPNHQSKKNSSTTEVQMKYKIPEELAERLRECRISLTEQVLVKISNHHISQAYGAITHVENTWTTIQDPKAIFLYQLSKQPIEKLGQRHPPEWLERQKREQLAINDEIARGRPSIKEMPRFQALKEKLAKKIGTLQAD